MSQDPVRYDPRTVLVVVADGLGSTVRWDATRAVDVEPGDGDRARAELADTGVALVGA